MKTTAYLSIPGFLFIFIVKKGIVLFVVGLQLSYLLSEKHTFIFSSVCKSSMFLQSTLLFSLLLQFFRSFLNEWRIQQETEYGDLGVTDAAGRGLPTHHDSIVNYHTAGLKRRAWLNRNI